MSAAGAHRPHGPLDPDLAAVLPSVPVVDLRDLARARRERAERTAATPPPDLTGVGVEDRTVAGPPGAGAVGVRLYRPLDCGVGGGGVGALLHVHGGGFVLGDVAMDEHRCVTLCRELGALVVSVEYALAPEHPYPRAIDDVWSAWCWLHDQARALGVDPARTALRGISAGGALAAATALRARDDPARQPALLHLVAPVLDDRMDTASMRACTDTPIWHRDNAARSWAAYLGEGVPGTAAVDALAAPARASSLTGMPATYLAVMQLDPLRDEALAFAAALARDGVPVEAHLFPGTFHTSAGVVPDAGISRRQLDEEIAVLRTGLR